MGSSFFLSAGSITSRPWRQKKKRKGWRGRKVVLSRAWINVVGKVRTYWENSREYRAGVSTLSRPKDVTRRRCCVCWREWEIERRMRCKVKDRDLCGPGSRALIAVWKAIPCGGWFVVCVKVKNKGNITCFGPIKRLSYPIIGLRTTLHDMNRTLFSVFCTFWLYGNHTNPVYCVAGGIIIIMT